MWRHKKERIITQKLDCVLFTPTWIDGNISQEVIIMMDEIESINLADVEWLDMKVSAKKMWISAPTFCRILASARKKIWTAILYGYSIKVCSWVEKDNKLLK